VNCSEGSKASRSIAAYFCRSYATRKSHLAESYGRPHGREICAEETFGVVSPNVRNNNRTVGQWRQASVAC
jgi:hypothetical protein